MVSKIYNQDYWKNLKEEGSELMCSKCKQVILYSPENYSEELIKQLVLDHRNTHVVHKNETYEEDIVF